MGQLDSMAYKLDSESEAGIKMKVNRYVRANYPECSETGKLTKKEKK